MDEAESVHQAAAEAKKAQERKLKGLEEKQVERCPVRNPPTFSVPQRSKPERCVRCLCAALQRGGHARARAVVAEVRLLRPAVLQALRRELPQPHHPPARPQHPAPAGLLPRHPMRTLRTLPSHEPTEERNPATAVSEACGCFCGQQKILSHFQPSGLPEIYALFDSKKRAERVIPLVYNRTHQLASGPSWKVHSP